MRVNIATLKAAFEAAKIGSARFVSVKNYRNQQGEVSNYLIQLGMKYEEQREKDIVKLMAVSFEGVKELVRREMLASKLDNTTNEYRTNGSFGQLDAYEELCENVKIHKGKEELYLKAFLVQKDVLVSVESKRVHGYKTMAKYIVSKELDLTTDKYRLFRFSNMEKTQVGINGRIIEITYPSC